MKLCHSCSAQFDETFDRCLHCGGRLSSEPLESSAAASQTELSEYQLIATQQPIWVPPLLEALEEAGIPFAIVTSGGTRGVDPLQGSHGTQASVQVHVPNALADEASQIQSRVFAEQLPDLPEGYEPRADASDRCPACGARISDAPECPGCGLFLGDPHAD